LPDWSRALASLAVCHALLHVFRERNQIGVVRLPLDQEMQVNEYRCNPWYEKVASRCGRPDMLAEDRKARTLL
jgi:hypothetical protein